VEKYRAQAERVSRGATGVRLEVPPGPPDEITRLGTTLNSMLDELERSALRQQQFIDDASHELRTPLSTLTAEIDVALLKPRTTDEYEPTLRRLADDTAEIRALADALLALGALGSATPNATEVAAAELLGGTAVRARGQLDEDSGRVVEIQVANGLTLRADEALVGRALGNLADNAVRHGSGTITLSAEPEADDTL